MKNVPMYQITNARRNDIIVMRVSTKKIVTN